MRGQKMGQLWFSNLHQLCWAGERGGDISNRSVPSSVLLNNAPKWDTISWSLRLQRPTIWGFGHKNYHSYQYQQYPHIFVLFLYPLFVFFLVSGNISLLKSILGAFLFYCELKYFWALKKCEIIHWNERINKGPYAVSFLSIGLIV